MFKGKSDLLLFGSFGLIVLAVGLVAALDAFKPEGNTDVRARAASVKTLLLNGTVAAIDESIGTLTVNDVYFADESRSGEAKNLGTWTVSPPANFSLGSVSPGSFIVIGVDTASFKATTHTMTALSIAPGTK